MLLLFLLPPLTHAHGNMLTPIPRQPEPRYFYSVGCMSGCNCSGGGKEPYPSLASVGCATPTEPTLPVSSRTWNTAATSPKGDWTRYMPWRAPGTAIPLDVRALALQAPCSFASPCTNV